MLFNLRKPGKLVISSLLVALFIIGVSQPALGNGATIEVDPSIVTVTVSNNFEVDIWIRNLPSAMTEFSFTVTWDDTQISLDSYVEHDHGWTSYTVTTPGTDSLILAASGSSYTLDASWITLTFHCINAGSSSINLENTAISYLETSPIDHTAVDGTVTQNPSPDPPSHHPVGGIYAPMNKLNILVPYVALIGLFGVLSTILINRKWRKS